MKYEEGKLDFVRKMNFNEPLRAVSWNPIKPFLCAVGGFSGKIVVVNADTYKLSNELNGCKDKILSLKWHPFFDYILASGSADNTVRVWDTKNVSSLNIYFAREWAQDFRAS